MGVAENGPNSLSDTAPRAPLIKFQKSPLLPTISALGGKSAIEFISKRERYEKDILYVWWTILMANIEL